MTLKELLVKIGVDASGLKSGLADAQRSFSGMSSQMIQAGSSLSIGLTAPLTLMGGAALRAGQQFESSINQIQGVLQPTPALMQRVRDTAIKMGADTVFSAKDSADAMLELGKAGFTTEQALSGVGPVLQLAAASGWSMADSASMAARTMNGFGLEVKDLNHINDVLAQGVNSTSLEMGDLQTAFAYIAPIAKGLGVSFEQTTAALGLMRDAGIAAETTGRALREGLTRLVNPTKDVYEGLAQWGVTVTDATGKLLPFDEIIRRLEPHAKDTAVIMKVFGDAAGPGMQALLSKGSGALNKLTDDLKHSDGAAKSMADAMMKGLPGAMEQLRGSVDSMLIGISKAMEPATLSILNFATSGANAITNTLIPAFQSLPGAVQMGVIGIVGLGAAIGPALLAIAGMGRLLNVAVEGYTAAKTAATLFGNALPVITARVWLMDAAGGALSLTLSGLATAAGIFGAAMIGWNIGKWIADMKLFAGSAMTVADSFEFGYSKLLQWAGFAPKVSDADLELAITSRHAAKATTEHKDATEELAKQGIVAGNSIKDVIDATTEQAHAAGTASEAMKKLMAAFSGDDALKSAREAMGAMQSVGGASHLTKGELEDVGKALNDLIEKFGRLGKQVPADMKAAADGVAAALAGIELAKVKYNPDPRLLNMVMPNVYSNPNLRPLEAGSRDVFGLPAPNVKSQRVSASPVLNWLGGMKESMAQLGPTILSAFTGGGNPGQAIGGLLGGGLTKGLGDFMSKKLGGTIGSVFGSVIPGLGTMLGGMAGQLMGPLMSKIGGLFKGLFGGPSAQEKDGRSVANAFRETFAGILSASQQAEVAASVAQGNNKLWAETVIGVRDAYIRAGLSEAQALEVVDRLWKAEKEGGSAVQRVIDEITAAVKGDFAPATAAALDQMQGGLEETTKKAEQLLAVLFDMSNWKGPKWSSDTGGEGTSEGKNSSGILAGKTEEEAKYIYTHGLGSPGSTDQDWDRVKSQYGFATGGIVTKPLQGLVGEAGPEAIIPLSRLGDYVDQGQPAASDATSVLADIKTLLREQRTLLTRSVRDQAQIVMGQA